MLPLSGFSQAPTTIDPKIAKEIDELEQRINKLQEKFKALKDAATTAPAKSPPAADALPAQLDKLFSWRSIGPANMGGRITSLAVFETDPTCYYVATASGGLLKTI